MKKTGRTIIVAAAMSGLLSGAALNQGFAQTTNQPAAGKVAPLAKTPKVHGCSGENDCKALGGCKTDDHTCKFKNSCKGKGGCSLTKKDIQDWEKQQKLEKEKQKQKNKAAAAAKPA